tara:strand:+ start:133 stop:312 length:180 start_codon:yes stop_codon:yes gene_type:complete
MWNRIKNLLQPPKHPGNTKPPKEPLGDELVVARTAWENEQTMATATRYITLLEVARQIQ